MDIKDLKNKIIEFLTSKHSSFLKDLEQGNPVEELLIEKKSIEKFLEIIIDNNTEFSNILKESLKDFLSTAQVLDEERALLIDKLRIATPVYQRPLRVSLGSLSAKHINKVLSLRAIVIQETIPKPSISIAKYLCRDCGEEIEIPTDSLLLKKPLTCDMCGEKNAKVKFILQEDSCEYSTTQRLLIQEPYEDISDSSKPVQLEALIPESLINKFEVANTNIFIGKLRLKPRSSKNETINFDWYLEILDIKQDKESLEHLEITREDILSFNNIKQTPVKNLIKYIVPKVRGMDFVKEAILLQLVGGVTRENSLNNRKRGEIHILAVGNPGTAKSELMNSIKNIIPRVQTASGGDTTRVGLTASVQQMEFMGQKEVILTPGALVLGHKSIVLIDEFDKMRDDDKTSLHTAMEEGMIHIHKFNQHQNLKTEVSIFAVGNPKNNTFSTESLKNIHELPFQPSLLSRFDLVFLIGDEIQEQHLPEIYDAIYSFNNDVKVEEDLDIKFLRKYIAYAKKFEPKIPGYLIEDYKKETFSFFKNIKEGSRLSGNSFNLRIANSIQRLAEASAKLRLSNDIIIEDILFAKDILIKAFESAGIYVKKGKTDLDLLNQGISQEFRNDIKLALKIINDYGKISIDELSNITGFSLEKTEKIITKLMHSGNIFETKPRIYRVR